MSVLLFCLHFSIPSATFVSPAGIFDVCETLGASTLKDFSSLNITVFECSSRTRTTFIQTIFGKRSKVKDILKFY